MTTAALITDAMPQVTKSAAFHARLSELKGRRHGHQVCNDIRRKDDNDEHRKFEARPTPGPKHHNIVNAETPANTTTSDGAKEQTHHHAGRGQTHKQCADY